MSTNGEIKIEKGIPLPSGSARASKYPFAQMKVGDSFSVPDSSDIVYNSSVWAKRHPPFKFATRKQGDGTRRIWRVA